MKSDYEERVYAGVLGKIIGVYLGRPFEGWSHARIERELGEITGYVHERLGQPLIVTDDDISGTFTFLRALPENGNDPGLTAAQIGDWWLNAIIENRTILWWGGLGMSTEHTAYLRLADGRAAPDSGSIAVNGRTVAEQIGAQIFIDGWGLICPGDPAKAADLARRAASVSHDGEAVYAAQVVAALVAGAFAEPDIQTLLDIAVGLVPADSVIVRLIGDVREWAAANGDDWRATLRRIQARYGPDKFGGNCHVVPNHAVILLSLLHGRGDFHRSLMIANTSGWDTDCNSGNVGCILGVRNGLAGFAGGPDWRGPVADRMYLPTADGGRAITDALRETYEIVNIARALAGQPPRHPKNGARFHFSLPGSVQGFAFEDTEGMAERVTVTHDAGRLALGLSGQGTVRVATATFTPPSALSMPGYGLVASPTLYPGQTVTARVIAADDLSGTAQIGLHVRALGAGDTPNVLRGPTQSLRPGQSLLLDYTVPDTGGCPVAEVGLEVTVGGASGTVLLDWLTWDGVPDMTFQRPAGGGQAWERVWVNAASEAHFGGVSPERLCRVISNRGTGLLLTGEWTWTGYAVATEILPHLCRRTGLCAAVRGLRRYVALVLDDDGHVRLVEQCDRQRHVLAESRATWEYEAPMRLSLTLTPQGIWGSVGSETLAAQGAGLPTRGGIGLLVETGLAEFGPVRVRPAP